MTTAQTTADATYLSLVEDVLKNGKQRQNRTGVDTLSVFGRQVRYNLRSNFPLLTTKRVPFKSVAVELLWFLRGDTNTKYLKDHNVTIWDEWADKDGNLGPVYGKQWRKWTNLVDETPKEFESLAWQASDVGFNFLDYSLHVDTPVDQIAKVIETIKTNPESRRLIVSAWNPVDVDKMALPPCHTMFQFFVEDGELSCQLYQRSADLGLGVPFNVASYALLTHLVAQVTGLKVGDFIHTFGDAHIYVNHVDQLKLQLTREPRAPLPTLSLDPAIKSIDDFRLEHIKIENYNPHPTIKMDVAV